MAAIDHSLLELARAVRRTGYQFITVTPESHRRVNARPENSWARNLADVFGWSRKFDPSILPTGLLELMQVADAVVRDGSAWRSRYRLSSIDQNLFIHSAYPTEAADAVFFGPDTYRFAAAMSQELRSRAHAWHRAVDIGCGTGAAGILLAQENSASEVVLTDINAAALRLSKINAALAGTTNVMACEADLLEGVGGSFDLIVANPPYLLDSGERLYRHGGGIRGEGLSLRIVDTALARLAPGGRLFLYTGVAIVEGVDLFRRAVADRLRNTMHDWRYRELDPDVFGDELIRLDADRIAAVFLTLTKAR